MMSDRHSIGWPRCSRYSAVCSIDNAASADQTPMAIAQSRREYEPAARRIDNEGGGGGGGVVTPESTNPGGGRDPAPPSRDADSSPPQANPSQCGGRRWAVGAALANLEPRATSRCAFSLPS